MLDPFRPETPALSLALPFYAYLFVALLIGVLLGGTAMWLSQAAGGDCAHAVSERRAGRPRPTACARTRSNASTASDLAIASR